MNSISRTETLAELRAVYTDEMVWVFLGVGVASVFVSGSFLWGLVVVSVLSSMYLAGGYHHK